MFLTIILAYFANNIQSGNHLITINNKIIKALKVIIPIILIILLTKSIQNHISYNKLHKTLTEQKQTPLSGNLQTLSELENRLRDDTGFMLIYAYTLYESEQDSLCLEKIAQLKNMYPTNSLYILEGDCLKRLRRYKEAEQSYRYAHYMVPSRQRARSRLAFLYKETGRYAEGKRLAEEILTEKVKVYGFDTYDLHKKIKEAFMD